MIQFWKFETSVYLKWDSCRWCDIDVRMFTGQQFLFQNDKIYLFNDIFTLFFTENSISFRFLCGVRSERWWLGLFWLLWNSDSCQKQICEVLNWRQHYISQLCNIYSQCSDNFCTVLHLLYCSFSGIFDQVSTNFHTAILIIVQENFC